MVRQRAGVDQQSRFSCFVQGALLRKPGIHNHCGGHGSRACGKWRIYDAQVRPHLIERNVEPRPSEEPRNADPGGYGSSIGCRRSYSCAPERLIPDEVGNTVAV
jgi:hypothetical protein